MAATKTDWHCATHNDADERYRRSAFRNPDPTSVVSRFRLDFGDGMVFFGRYLDVTPHSRIVCTNDDGGQNGSVTAVTFEETGGNTLLTMAEAYPSREALDEAGTGAADATHETFAQLDDLLAQLNA